ncbi:putative anthocyanidin reductase isoform X1 [Hibiscus syriacus]|uniref:putative anthocyanidin reductase isoform X1 n=1 Tax=Hibiscus syriacus TaxID=106335 RepID=UPI00192291D5|nr:putative anthocyanidin reductase isoform X1 [Hibiscus syriacus]XP_039022824.1 putative anthocyanidin reductase isoform X1 [Hibiscus syriacus]
MEKQATSKVCCVTGGSGYLGSWLVKKLLEKGYTVHATLRNLDDKSKVGFLNSLPGAATKLVLFQADIYNPDEFKHAIQGCEFVFHVATPMQTTDTQSSQEIIEAAISGVRSIAESCLQSPAVKRLIYTASVLGASPLTKDGFNINSCVNESSWTHVDVASTHGLQYLRTYTISKTLAEKEALRYNGEANANGGKLEVVSLACGLVGGETLLSFVPLSMAVMFSQLIGNLSTFVALEYLEQLLGSVPIVHIDDVCEAHVFCMEKPSMDGRFICAAANPTITQIAAHFRDNYSQHQIPQDYRLMGVERKALHGTRASW